MTEFRTISGEDWKNAMRVSRFRQEISEEARRNLSRASQSHPDAGVLIAAREKLLEAQKRVEACDFITNADKLVLTWRIMRAGLAIKTALERVGKT